MPPLTGSLFPSRATTMTSSGCKEPTLVRDRTLKIARENNPSTTYLTRAKWGYGR